MLGSCPVVDYLPRLLLRCWHFLGQRYLFGFNGKTYFKDFFHWFRTITLWSLKSLILLIVSMFLSLTNLEIDNHEGR